MVITDRDAYKATADQRYEISDEYCGVAEYLPRKADAISFAERHYASHVTEGDSGTVVSVYDRMGRVGSRIVYTV